ncbi:MAG: fructosamine kinase family protein [Betaproteobacteria bacterium]
MIKEHPWTAVGASIEHAVGTPLTITSAEPLGGGCINEGFRLRTSRQQYFVKFNRSDRLRMFDAEAAGLSQLAATKCIRVPQPVCASSTSDFAWLVLEFVPFSSGGLDSATASRLGTQLAALHRCSHNSFGWSRDNTIGSTTQINTPESDWIVFWREHRLRFQLELVGRSAETETLRRSAARLLDRLPGFFADYHPAPSLLHGDLWGGNAAVMADGEPVLFDPAVYYGDREADLAMTELFGGFPPAFYTAYRDAWPLDRGYAQRRDLYNLYHVLNHLNLFGGSYLHQAERMIDGLLGRK